MVSGSVSQQENWLHLLHLDWAAYLKLCPSSFIVNIDISLLFVQPDLVRRHHGYEM